MKPEFCSLISPKLEPILSQSWDPAASAWQYTLSLVLQILHWGLKRTTPPPLAPLALNYKQTSLVFSSVQPLSRVRTFATPRTAACQDSLSITNVGDAMMTSNCLILCRPLLLLPSIFPSITGFSSASVLRIRWPKYWNFSFNISPSSEYSGLISFRIDWFDLLTVQGTLKSLLQHHSSKASILRHSAFFSPTLTSIHDYWKNHSFDQIDLCWQSNVSAF